MRSLPVFVSLVVLSAVLAGCAPRARGPQPIVPTAEEENRAVDGLLRQFDLNRDGQITCADLESQRRALFAQIDEDQNGTLRRGEYRFAAFEDQSFQFYDFVDVDKNEDGLVDFNEFSAVSNNNYARLDRNRDCLVTRAEMIAASQDFFRAGRAAEARKRRRQQKNGPDLGDFDNEIELEDIPPSP